VVERSGVVTFTTDFGLTEPYVAMMKGVVLTIHPKARLVDLSHQIRAGAVSEAAGVILEAFPFFPKGTVHVAVVDPGVGSERRLLALEARDHFFVGPDNGIFWPVIKSAGRARFIELTEKHFFQAPISQTFHGREIFAPIAAHLARGIALERLGRPIDDPVQLDVPSPFEENEVLYGEIVHRDHFGNLITNIDRSELERFLRKAQPVITVGSLVVRGLHRIYGDVEAGNTLALINSADKLELAVNLGSASEYIGVREEDILGSVVQVKKS
jgi:S-adenosylmethionine hydrolase